MKLLIMFAISSSPHLPKSLILRHPQPMFLPQYKRPRFTPIQNKGQNYISVHLEKRKTKDSGPNDSVTKYVIYQGWEATKNKPQDYFYVCTVHFVHSFYFNQQCTVYIFLFDQSLYYNHFYVFRYISIISREFRNCSSPKSRSSYIIKLSLKIIKLKYLCDYC